MDKLWFIIYDFAMRRVNVDVYTNDSPSKLEGVPRRGEGVCEYTNETHSSGLRHLP